MKEEFFCILAAHLWSKLAWIAMCAKTVRNARCPLKKIKKVIRVQVKPYL
uniref:Uncharacterized protein n=1 Tax=Arundo donax TaxID=35708 RepID=A0A0A9AZR1_ARUDO